MSDPDGRWLDPAETAVYDRLRALGCATGPADPTDPEDCAGVAVEVVAALREHGHVAPTRTHQRTTPDEEARRCPRWKPSRRAPSSKKP